MQLTAWLLILALLAGACTPAGPPPENPPPAALRRTPLRVFCAGSLILPFAELERAFEAAHPEVDVQNECHGSIQVIRHVTELHEAIDVVATADHALIPQLMYTAQDPASGRPYASWYIRFASNRLALAYSPRRPAAAEAAAPGAAWYSLLARPDLRLGLADPRFDAAGYRALMVLQLAEAYYRRSDIFKTVIDDKFKYPITVFKEDDRAEISVPEVLEPKAGANLVLRGASIQLIALLEAGELDYAFEYESVIRQHGLPWVALPAELNLGEPDYAEQYGRVQVKMDFQRFASLKPVFKGEQIGYGIVIPSSAPQPALAAEFIAFLLGPPGRAVMAANYQPLLAQPVCDQPANVPAPLDRFCAPAGPP